MYDFTYFQSVIHKLTRRARNRTQGKNSFDYGTFEPRRVLAPLFPAFVNGSFSMGDADATTPYPTNATFNLESNPGSSKTIYLDFTGHSSYNNDWGHSIAFPRYDIDGNTNSFSARELADIQGIFQNVAEDFLPFNVNVTTKQPGNSAIVRSGSGDNQYGVRVVMTQPTAGFGVGTGGKARLNTFGDNRDTPVFVFGKHSNVGAIIASHEVGHALGLTHDGYYGDTYHRGTGSGATKWGPLLGAPYNANLTQWSNGDYAGANNRQDDISIIRSRVGMRPDDVGNTFASASSLHRNGEHMSEWGVIGTRSDVDVYRFTVPAGSLTLSVDPFALDPNLDVLATLHDASGNVIATQNPASQLGVTFDEIVPGGTYYLKVDGAGKAGAYSDYGSLGFYRITGQSEAVEPSIIGESATAYVSHGWQTIQLENRYSNPAVIAGPATRVGHDPATVRIRNVRSGSFEMRIEEWDYLDQLHAFESVNFLVVESGRHTLADGTEIYAQNGHTNSEFRDIDFGQQFDNVPVVLAQTISQNDDAAVETRVRNVTQSGFEVKLQEQESRNRQRPFERVSFIAVEQGISNASGMAIEAFLTPERYSSDHRSIQFQRNYQNTPVVFTEMQTFNGTNPAALRRVNLNENAIRLFIEEERSKDAETGHSLEAIGYFAMRQGHLLGIASSENSPAPNEPLETEGVVPIDSALVDNAFSDGQQFDFDADHDDHDHHDDLGHDDDHDHDHVEELPVVTPTLEDFVFETALSSLSLEALIEEVGHFA